jgi:hypothetical protein
VQLLKFGKKYISQTVESMGLDKNIESILVTQIKNQLHMINENTIQDISKMSDNKESYFGYLFKLEQESKRKF